MIFNKVYKKGKKTKEYIYGLRETDESFSIGEKPIVFSIVPINHTQKSVNGSINVAGKALGVVSNPQESSELMKYTWHDMDQSGIEIVSAHITDAKLFYDRYFSPILKDKNGNYKDFNSLLKIFNNITILSYCDSTKDIFQISQHLEKELYESGLYNKQQIDSLLKQICAIDVTSRISMGESKFTSIHLYSKADNELEHPQQVREKKSGISVINDHEACIIVDKLMTTESDHIYDAFFEIGEKKTSQGKVVGFVVEKLVSDVVSRFQNGKSLNNITESSTIFSDSNQTFIDHLMEKQDFSKEEEEKLKTMVIESRFLPKECEVDSEKKERYSIYNENISLYLKINELKLEKKINDIDLFMKRKLDFENLKIYKDISPEIKERFEKITVLFQDMKKLLLYCNKKMESITFSDDLEGAMNNSKILKEIYETTQMNFGLITKSLDLLDLYFSLENFDDPKVSIQWGKKEGLEKFIKNAEKNFEDDCEKF